MTPVTIASLSIFCLLTLIMLGVHIGFSLAAMSFLGVWCLTGNLRPALSMLSTTSFEGIREYIFAVIPLFVMMGCFMSRSGVARNLFAAFNYFLKRLPGGLGIATVISNAVFAAVTGVSVASAAVFSRVCLPEMDRYHYQKGFALGAVAGSSVLGMLIPPSVLMIVYGMLSETSIGKLFLAGFIPGIVLSFIFSLGIILMIVAKPGLAGLEYGPDGKRRPIVAAGGDEKEDRFILIALRALPIFLIVLLVLGGIWGGFFTPIEASAVGALSTFVVSLGMGMSFKEFRQALLESVGTTASILFLLISAQMYSRMLAMSGVTVRIGNYIAASGMSSLGVLLLICLILIALGCVLDSTSILLLTIPLILPVASAFHWNLVWLGILLIVVVEMGLLTPPFGMVVFAMKATIGEMDADVSVEQIFRGAFPFLLMMVIEVALLIAFPWLATWLPGI
jgi:tripartite ATP-independent transporter DctM subunit